MLSVPRTFFWPDEEQSQNVTDRVIAVCRTGRLGDGRDHDPAGRWLIEDAQISVIGPACLFATGFYSQPRISTNRARAEHGIRAIELDSWFP